MTMTVAGLASKLAKLVAHGHGENVVLINTFEPGSIGRSAGAAIRDVMAGIDWDHGTVRLVSECSLKTLTPADVTAELKEARGRHTIEGFRAYQAERGIPEAVPVELPAPDPVAVVVERDELGLWKHPAHPEDMPAGELAEWLTMRDLTFTLNYLLEPEDGHQLPEGDYSAHELRVPAGDWFLWMISANSAGDCVALWVAPTK